MKRGSAQLIALIAIAAAIFTFLIIDGQKTPTGLQFLEPQVTSIGGMGDCGLDLTTPDETYELTSDIAVCTGNGLNINASGITIDCLGFSITGDGGSTGIISSLPRENLTIRNCIISGFDFGIALNAFTNFTTITNNTVFNITALGSAVGIDGANDGVNNTVTYNTVTTTDDIGISWGGTGETGLFIAHNLVHSNSLVGIAANSANATIYNNTLFNNSAAGGNVGALEITIRDNTLAYENTVHNNSDQGVELSSSGGNTNFTFRNNIINGSGYYGLLFNSDAGDTEIYVMHNTISNNSRFLESFGDAALQIQSSEIGTFINNTILENFVEGVQIEDSNHIEIINSTSTENAGSGITTTGTTNNLTFEGNQLHTNNHTGLEILGTATNYYIINNNASANNQSGISGTVGSTLIIENNIMNNNLGQATGLSITYSGGAVSLGAFGDSCTADGECSSNECDDPDGDGTGTCDDGTCGAGEAGAPQTACDDGNDGDECEFFDGSAFCNFSGCCEIGAASISSQLQFIPDAEVNITNNTANNNNGNGFQLQTIDNANVNNNVATNNTGNGFNITGTNSDIEFNLADLNGINGFEISGTSENLTINNNNATNNTQTGFAITAQSIIEFSHNRAIGNLGPNTGGDITVTGVTSGGGPALGGFGDPCADNGDCTSGECDDPDGDLSGTCDDGTCGAGAGNFFSTACNDANDADECTFFAPGFCGFMGCCEPDAASITYLPQALPLADTNITNNTAIENNGTGWHFVGFTNTNFIDNTAINNTGYGFDFENVTLSDIDNTTAIGNDGGIQLNETSNNTINLSYINTLGEPGYNIVDGSQNNTIINATITSPDDWIYIGAPLGPLSSDNTFINLRLNNSFGTILFLADITPPDPRTVEQANTTMAQSTIFLNSTDIPEFNVSAHLTMYNVTSTDIEVAFDDVNFVDCPALQCDNITLVGTTLDFDVVSFTTYTLGTPAAATTGGGGSGGGSASTICPPSCSGLTAQEREKIPHCAKLCITTPEVTQKVEQTPKPVQQVEQPTYTPPAQEKITTPIQIPEPEVQKLEPTKEQKQLETDYNLLNIIFYAIALIALFGLWAYTHHRHLRK